jgi:hypothetical protein
MKWNRAKSPSAHTEKFGGHAQQDTAIIKPVRTIVVETLELVVQTVIQAVFRLLLLLISTSFRMTS